MLQIKQKSINISVSRITNWPSSLSPVNFEIFFYSLNNSALITTKFVKGQYDRHTKSIQLNSLLRIKYAQDERKVILKLTYRMGIPGQIMLGQFIVDFQNLILNNQLNFSIDKTNNQFLIVEVYKGNSVMRTINKQANFYKQNLRIKKYPGSRNEDFIRERQQFLQKHSNRSSNSSSRSTEQFLFLSKANDLPPQLKNVRYNQIFNHLYNSPNQSRNPSISGSSRQSNRSENKSAKKSLIRFRTDKSQNHTQRTNQSSRKFVLLLKNLDIVPRDQYYQTRVQKTVTTRKARNLQKISNNQEAFPYLQSRKEKKKQIMKNRKPQDKINSQYF